MSVMARFDGFNHAFPTGRMTRAFFKFRDCIHSYQGLLMVGEVPVYTRKQDWTCGSLAHSQEVKADRVIIYSGRIVSLPYNGVRTLAFRNSKC